MLPFLKLFLGIGSTKLRTVLQTYEGVQMQMRDKTNWIYDNRHRNIDSC